MSESFTGFFAVLLALILYIAPSFLLLTKQDEVIQSYVSEEVVEFVNAVCTKGSLDERMYLEFIDKINTTNVAYKVEITHEHLVYQPVYDDSGTFMNETELVTSNTYEKDILKKVLEDKERYVFTEGDFISVRLSSRSQTTGEHLLSMIYQRDIRGGILFTYGGKIRNA